MIPLSIDITSESFAAGEALGVLLLVGGVMVLVWRLSAPWRRVTAPPGPLSAEQLAALRARRRNIALGALALIAVGGVAAAGASYAPEPRAADTDRARSQEDASGASGAAAGTDHALRHRTIAAPEKVEDYRLMSDQEAAPYMTPASKPPARYKRWYYDRRPDSEPDAVLSIDAVEWDPQLGAEKRRDSITQELRNFFAGAKAREVTSFAAGPMGGRLSCGYMNYDRGELIVCAWSDAATFGSLALTDTARVDDAARLTVAFRAAAERRS
ncbi:hypothetical protein [Streptomyces nigrescens]|uniref:hypothetical protein n=1 Tax=Streptomyces nigrescens TaxID=1920 RepID=UPI00348CC1FA